MNLTLLIWLNENGGSRHSPLSVCSKLVDPCLFEVSPRRWAQIPEMWLTKFVKAWIVTISQLFRVIPTSWGFSLSVACFSHFCPIVVRQILGFSAESLVTYLEVAHVCVRTECSVRWVILSWTTVPPILDCGAKVRRKIIGSPICRQLVIKMSVTLLHFTVYQCVTKPKFGV